jgi:hypothetical protein
MGHLSGRPDGPARGAPKGIPGTNLEGGKDDQEERMYRKGSESVPRQERLEPAWQGKEFYENVKFFLDNRAGKSYPPRFIEEGPTLRG